MLSQTKLESHVNRLTVPFHVNRTHGLTLFISILIQLVIAFI